MYSCLLLYVNSRACYLQRQSNAFEWQQLSRRFRALRCEHRSDRRWRDKVVHFVLDVTVEVLVEPIGPLADLVRNVRYQTDRVAGIGGEAIVIHLLLHHGHA